MKANALIAQALFVLVGTGCAAKQESPPLPPPAAYRTAIPGLPEPWPVVPIFTKDDWLGLTVINGNWRWAREGTLSVARLSLASGRERMGLSCDPATRLVSMTIDAPPTGSGMVSVTTTTLSKDVPIASVPDRPWASRITFKARDPLLDAIAFSRGRFMIQQAGVTPDVAPVQPEIGRVIEDCR
jgi:hypothetical protein